MILSQSEISALRQFPVSARPEFRTLFERARGNPEDVPAYGVTGAIATGVEVSAFSGALGVVAMTLADGTEGEFMIFVCTDATNPVTITPANASGFTAFTFNEAGDGAIVTFDGTNWNLASTTERTTIAGKTTIGTQDTATVTGALDITTETTFLDATLGAMAMTLADGVAGQVKTLVLINATAAATITPATAVGFTTAVLNAVQDAVTLKFDGTSWGIVSDRGNLTYTGVDYTETLVGAGAISLETRTTFLDAALGAMAMTLADGQVGQQKTCTLTDATGAVTITPATPVGFANIVLQNVGESVTFEFDGVSWNIISSNAKTQENLIGAGAVSVETDVTILDAGAGAMSMTLADGIKIGQIKTISMIDATGDVDVTIATPVSIIAIPIFGNVGDRLVLLWDGLAWNPLFVSLTADVAHTGAGAVPITNAIVIGTTGGVEAWTLADGVEGQELIVQIVAHGGIPTITPATATYFATMPFAGINDTAHLKMIGGAWMCIGATGGVTVT